MKYFLNPAIRTHIMNNSGKLKTTTWQYWNILIYAISELKYIERLIKKKISNINSNLHVALVLDFLIFSHNKSENLYEKKKFIKFLKRREELINKSSFNNIKSISRKLYLIRNEKIFVSFKDFLNQTPYIARIGYSPETTKLDISKMIKSSYLIENFFTILNSLDQQPNNKGLKMAIIESYLTKRIDDNINQINKFDKNSKLYNELFEDLREIIRDLPEKESII